MLLLRSSLRELLVLAALAPFFSASAQEITISTTFQTLTLSTAPGFAVDGQCSRNLQYSPVAELDAGDLWMQCSSFSAALPPASGLTLHGSSSRSFVSGSYSFINSDTANGSLEIRDADLGAAGLSCDNSACSLSSTSIHSGGIGAVNEPLYLDTVVLGANLELVNSALLARSLTIPEGKRLQMNGTNSDFHVKGLRCAPANAGISTASYRTVIKSKLKKKVTQLTGRVDLYRVVRSGKIQKQKWCASIGVNLTNGYFEVR